MSIDEFINEQKDYLLGGLSILPDNVPDGAWLQLRVDTVEYLCEPENLIMVSEYTNGRDFNFDSHDIVMRMMEMKLI